MDALKLWDERYPGQDTAIDFAGREMKKSAYNKRENEYGWNKDHIKPKKHGGTDAKNNIVLCNIKTNNEKGASFPCFKANGKNFEIKQKDGSFTICPIEKKIKDEAIDKKAEKYLHQISIIILGKSKDALIELIKVIFQSEKIQVEKMQKPFLNGVYATIDINQSLELSESKIIFEKCQKLEYLLKSLLLENKVISKYSILFKTFEHGGATLHNQTPVDDFGLEITNSLYVDSLGKKIFGTKNNTI